MDRTKKEVRAISPLKGIAERTSFCCQIILLDHHNRVLGRAFHMTDDRGGKTSL